MPPTIVNAGSITESKGVKTLVYGPAGVGKTPMMLTCPNPIALLIEDGTLSLNGATLPSIVCRTFKEIEESILWATSSKEADKFDTICVDSMSQISTNYLKHFKKVFTDPRKAYGEMGDRVKEILDKLKACDKNVYMTAKLGVREVDGEKKNTAAFEGQELIKLPHEIDVVLYCHKAKAQDGNEYLMFLTKETSSTIARDRSGRLAEYEPAGNINYIIEKVKGNIQ